MHASDYIKGLEEQLVQTEKLAERLRIKLEIAKEVAVEMDDGKSNLASAAPAAKLEPPYGNGVYRGLFASDAILRFLANHGVSPRNAILDALENNIKTTSSKPRNIVRNCLAQLAKKEKVEIDSSGNVSLRQH